MEPTTRALNATQQSAENTIDGITNAIVKADKVTIKVGLNDEAKQQLAKRENEAVSGFDKSLTNHKEQMDLLFKIQDRELRKIRDRTEGVHVDATTFWWMFVAWFIGVIFGVVMPVWQLGAN